MDKLCPVREVLIQKDDNWEEWGLEDPVENIPKYVERNPFRDSEDTGRKDDIPRNRPWRRGRGREKMLLEIGNNRTLRRNQKPTYVYCNSNAHFSHKYTKALDTAARRAIIQRNVL